jgi:hypothetical protein
MHNKKKNNSNYNSIFQFTTTILLPPAVGQVFGSFELIAAPEVAQALEGEEEEEEEGREEGEAGAGEEDNGDGDGDGDGGLSMADRIIEQTEE